MELRRKILAVLTAVIVVFIGMAGLLNIGAESSVGLNNNINNINIYPAGVFVGDNNVIMLFNNIFLQAFPGYVMQTNVDLSINNITTTESDDPGSACKKIVNFTVEICNNGDNEADNWNVNLTVDGILYPNVGPTGFIQSGECVPGIFNQTNGTSGTAPTPILLEPGSHNIVATVNVSGSYIDTNSSNNQMNIPYNIAISDANLSIVSITTYKNGCMYNSTPCDPSSQSYDCPITMDITAKINNSGCTNTTNVNVSFYIDDKYLNSTIINVKYDYFKDVSTTWNLTSGLINPLQGNHTMKVVIKEENKENKEKSTNVTTCTMADNTHITYMSDIQNITYGNRSEGLLTQINITSPSFTWNITTVYANFSDHTNGTASISKGNFSCLNCNGLNISAGDTKNITLQANFPEGYNGTYSGKTNLTFVRDDPIRMHYIYVYDSNLTVMPSPTYDYRGNETLLLDFGEQYQGTNVTLNFTTLSLPYPVKQIDVTFTDYYNGSSKTGSGNFTCTNCIAINATNMISAGAEAVVGFLASVPIDAEPNLTYWGNVTIKYITEGGPVYTEKRSSNLSVKDRNIINDLSGNASYIVSFGEQYHGLSNTISLNNSQINDNISNVEVIFTDYYNGSNIISSGNFSCTNCVGLTIQPNEVKELNLTAHYPRDAFPGNYYGNITVKLHGHVFVYITIYSSNLTVIDATTIYNYSGDANQNINFDDGSGQYLGLSNEINYSTLLLTDDNITNVSVEWTDYVPCNGTAGKISKGNFTCVNCNAVVPINNNEQKNLTLKAKYQPENDKTGNYCGNVTVKYTTKKGLIYIIIANSNLTVLQLPTFEYICPINSTGYCTSFVGFDPTIDGTNTTAKLPFDATNESNLNIQFVFSDLTCNVTDTPNCSGGNTIPSNSISWDKTEILKPNFDNVTFTMNVPAGTKAGNYTGKVNVSYVYNTSPPSQVKYINVSVKVTIENNRIIGKVVECEDNVTPIKDAVVRLRNRTAGNTDEIQTVNTSAYGSYSFSNIPEGNYTIYVEATGKIPNYINLSHNGFSVLSLPNLLLCKAANISGYVREATTDVCPGGPNQTSANVKVELISKSNDQVVCVNYTDSNGFFLFEYGQICAGYGQVMPGNYTIRFSKSGYIIGHNATTILNYTINYGHQINWSLCKAVVIEVNVTGCAHDNAESVNLEGAKVELVDANTGIVVKSSHSNSSGKVIFKDIASGTYYYKISKSGYISNENTSDICTYTPESSNCDREFPLCKAVVIEVNVTGCAYDNAESVNLEGARIDLIDFFTENIVKTKYSNASGKAIFEDVPAGTYYFKVTKLRYISNENKSAVCIYTSESSNCNREFSLCEACIMHINVTNNVSNPIETAQVKLFAENGTLITLRYTNANGTVQILGIPTGNYYANATKSGYTTASSIYDGLQFYSEETCGDIVLKISLKETVDVCVNDTDNNSLQGVKVDLIKVADNKIEKTLYTNATGCAVFNDISDSNYYINVSKPGYVSDQSDTFTYSETEGYFKPFQLLEKPKITGMVTDEATNQTIKGVLVQLCDLMGTCIMNTTTDINGTYKLVELPETGQYKLVFSKLEYNTEEVDNADGNLIVLNELTSYEINVSLVEKPNIDGYVDTNTTVHIKYLEGVTVQLDKDCNDVADNITTTDANGYYVFVAPVAGDYKLKFIKQGYLVGESNCTPFNAFNPLEINMSLDKAPSIDGYVLDQSNKTIKGAVVILDKDCDGTIENTTTTNAYGYYIFESPEAPPSGVKYCINAEKTGYISPETPYNISFSNAPYEVNISLTTKPSIYGYVTEEDNITPILGAKVVLDKGCNGEDATDVYQLTDNSGYFVFDQPSPDQYCIYASKSGYVSNELLPPEMPFFDGTSEIEVNISLAESAAAAKISGYVKDENGTPIENAIVELYKDCTELINTTNTFVNGYYEFTPEPGNYCIKVSKSGYNSMEENFATDPEFGTFNRTENFIYNFSLTLSITPYIQICVKDSETNETLSDALVEIYKGNSRVAYDSTNVTGCVKFYNISAGNYTVKASKHGYEENEGQIEYDEGILLSEIKLAVMKGIKVCVVEVNTTTPIAKANVTLFNSTFLASGETDSKGCYLFLNISYGNYSINATAKGYIPSNGTVEYLGDTNLTIKLTPLPRITICVYDNETGNETTGKRISNATVVLYNETVVLYNETLSYNANGTTDDTGCYKFMQEYVGQIPNGTYYANASATHYMPNGLITPFFNNTGDIIVDIGLVKPPRIIINVSYENNGSPIQNASVTLYNETWNETKFTNEEGMVEFFVPAGNYSFNVTLLGTLNVSGNINFNGSVHFFQPVGLRLDICGSIDDITILEEEGAYGVQRGVINVNVTITGKLTYNATASVVSQNGTIVGTFNLTRIGNTSTYMGSYDISNLNELNYTLNISLNDQCNTKGTKIFNVFYECISPTDPNCPITASLVNNNIAYCGDDNGCIGSISKGGKTDYGNRYELYSTIVWNYADEMENLSTVNFTNLTDIVNWQAATSMVKVGSSYYIAYEDYSNNNHNPKIRFIYLSSASATYQNISFEISQQGMRYYYPAMAYDNTNNKIYLVYMGRGEGDLQASLYQRECTPSGASLSCTNEEKIIYIPAGDAKEPAIARYNGKTYIAYANNSDIYICGEGGICTQHTHFAEKIAFNWNYSISGNIQELKDYLINNFGITWIANENPNITENEIKFTNVTLTLKNEINHTYYVLANILDKKYVFKVKKEEVIAGNITVYGALRWWEVETKGQKMNMTCEAHHPNILFKNGNLYLSYQVDTPLLDIIELHYPVKDKVTESITTYFVKAPLTDNRIHIDKCVQANCTANGTISTILHKAVSAEGVKKTDFDDANFDGATFSSIKNPWLFEFNNSVYVSFDATDAPYAWKYNESSTVENVVNLDLANITKTINMGSVKYGEAYTKCAFNNNSYVSSPNINKRDARAYIFNDPVITLTINANISKLNVNVGDDEITLTIDSSNITTVAPEDVLSENATLNNNIVTLKLNKSYYLKKIDEMETIGEQAFINREFVYNITVIVGNDTELKSILKVGSISIGDFVAPDIRDEDVKIVNLKDKGELHSGDTVYMNVSLKNREALPSVVKVFFRPYVNVSGNIISATPTGLQLGDPNLDKIFDNQGIENGFGGVGVEGTPYVLPDEVNNQTTYYLNVTVVVYDMCCNFQVWNKVLTITKKEPGEGLPCLECQPQPHPAISTRGTGGGVSGVMAFELPPTVTPPVTTTEGIFRSATETNYTLSVRNITAMEENKSFIVKVINETFTYNITYKQINTTNGTRWAEVNKTLINKAETPVSNANVEYAGQTAVTGTDGTTIIPKAIAGTWDIRATKAGAEVRTTTVIEVVKPKAVEKEILIVSLLKGAKEKEGIYEFEVRDKKGNLATNREFNVKLPDNTTQKVVTDEQGRFSLTINQSGYLIVDQQEYADYAVEHFALPVEIETKKHDYWIWFLLLLPILLLIYLILFMMKGKVEITKERGDGKVSITIANKTHKTLDACMLEDVIPLGLQVEVITQGLERTAMGDTLIMNLGNLKKGEKRIAEYKITNAEGIKGAGAKGLPEAKVVWSNGEQRSKNI
ncbi:MAG: hypothetical protein GW770_02130 [Candidatus Altiarchaeum hamiconexum]|nr:hypothetical protein [Candidatus Altarchaeum hamiconexum]